MDKTEEPSREVDGTEREEELKAIADDLDEAVARGRRLAQRSTELLEGKTPPTDRELVDRAVDLLDRAVHHDDSSAKWFGEAMSWLDDAGAAGHR